MKTLGQIAYEAYHKDCADWGIWIPYWGELEDKLKVQWENAAQAVSDEIYDREREV